MDSGYYLRFIHCREFHVVFAQALARSMIVTPALNRVLALEWIPA